EEAVEENVRHYEMAMDERGFNKALRAVWTISSLSNKYIDETTPWVLAKDEANREAIGNTMVHVAENVGIAAILIKPYLTHGPKEIFRQMNITDNNLQTFDSIFKYGSIKIDEQMVKKPQPIYPRLDVEAEVSHIKELMTPDKKEADEGEEESAEG